MMVPMTSPAIDLDDPQLLALLERARSQGLLGPGPLRAHLEHASRYLNAIEALTPDLPVVGTLDAERHVLDLGSGAGLPGLPLLKWLPNWHGTLLDARTRRCAFLRTALTDLGLDDRGVVAEGRAEVLSKTLGMRGRYDLVVSRGFGPPAFTVECALGFLRPGASILISEPPERRPWADLMLDDLAVVVDDRHPGLIHLRVDGDPSTSRFPRSLRAMRREPLFILAQG